MFEFEPEDNLADQDSLPYWDDARAADGWKGQTTSKSISQLQAAIREELNRLGGVVTRMQRGWFNISNPDPDKVRRAGLIIGLKIIGENGAEYPAEFNVAALPVRPPKRHSDRAAKMREKHEKSLRMCLFNVRDVLQSNRILKLLSPGYEPMLPLLLEKRSGKTLGMLWQESPALKALTPPDESDFEPDGDVMEGTFREE